MLMKYMRGAEAISIFKPTDTLLHFIASWLVGAVVVSQKSGLIFLFFLLPAKSAADCVKTSPTVARGEEEKEWRKAVLLAE